MALVYEIATSITMTNGVSPVLALIGRDLLGIEGGIARLTSKLSNIRTQLAVGGGLSIVGGLALAGGLKAMADHAKDLSHELVQIKKLNIGDGALAQVRSAAIDVVHQVPGTSEVDALKTYGASYSMFGHEGALSLMKSLSEFAQVSGNTSGNYEKAANNVYSMVRSGDLMGKFVNETTHQVDPEKLKGFLDLGSKVILGTHGKVDSNAWFQLAQMGGPALSTMTDKGLLTMAIAAQAMGGPRAGTALTSLYQQMVGGKMTENAAHHLHDMGLVGDYKVGKGGHLLWGKGALETPFTEALKRDPMNAVQIMKEHMEAHGLDSIEKQIPELFQMLGRQTTQRLIHDLLRNMPQIMGERERIAGSMGTGDSASLQNKEDYEQVQHNMGESWKNLMYAISGPNSENAIAVMNKITEAMNGMADAVRSTDPEVLKNIGIGLAALSAALVVGGAAALLAALGPAGWLVAGITALGIAVAALWPAFHKIPTPTSAQASDQLEHPLRPFPSPATSEGLPPEQTNREKQFAAIGKFFRDIPGMIPSRAAINDWGSRVSASFGGFINGVLNKIVNQFKKGIQVGTVNLKNIMPPEFWADLENIKGLGPKIRAAFMSIPAEAESVYGEIKAIGGKIKDAILENIKGLGPKIRAAFMSIPAEAESVYGEIKAIGGKIKDAILSIPGMVGNAASEMASAIGAKISAAVKSVMDGIGNFMHNQGGNGGHNRPAEPSAAPEKHSKYVPTHDSRPVQMQASIHLDKRLLGQVVAQEVTHQNRTVNSSNGFDGGAHWAPPDVG